jgi:hypothetical protein
VTHTTSYTAANCTRYIYSGRNPFFTVRMNVAAGWSLRCYFPGFINPTSGYGSRLTVNFFTNSMHHFKNQNLPYPHFSQYQTLYVYYGLTSQSTINSMYRAD